MKTIGLLYYPQREDSASLAAALGAALRQELPAGMDLWQGTAQDEAALRQAAPKLDLLVALGGDGTIMRAVRAVAQVGVPILGVNLGRLGFLAELAPAEAQRVIPALAQGRYRIEERAMLHVELRRGEQVLWQAEGINDAVLARGGISRTVRIAVAVDGRHVMTPTADGIIVSTPTGSTAYCLSAGGPIIAPDLPGLAITPVAAHLGIVKSLVIPAERQVTLTLEKGEGAALTVDGQVDYAARPGDSIYCSTSAYRARFVRFGDASYYYETVLRRLGWAERS